jgi:hypothetical protein
MILTLDNLKAPDNPKLKKIANIVLYILPLEIGAIMAAPFNETTKLWLIFGLTEISIIVKAVSKLSGIQIEETNE